MLRSPWGSSFSCNTLVGSGSILVPAAERAGVRRVAASNRQRQSIPGRMAFPTIAGVAMAMFLALACGRARADGTGYLFVSNERTNNITVIDPSRDYTVIKSISTSRHPGDMRFGRNGHLLLVACEGDAVIDVIDIATLQVEDHIATHPGLAALELSRDGLSAYVPSDTESIVQQIDVAHGSIDRLFHTGARPRGIALSPDQMTLYVSSLVDDLVHVIDLHEGATVENIKVGTYPDRLLLLPHSEELWVANELSGQVSIIDRSSNKIVANLEFSPPGSGHGNAMPGGMIATADGKTVIVALGQADYLALIDVTSHRIKAYLPVGRWSRDVTLSDDERTLYVVDRQDDNVMVMDMASRQVVRTIHVGIAPRALLVDNATNPAVGKAKAK
jgi:YVTN family beta-propeller protein